MNCCDDYGNCHQSRDCPIRVERIRQAKEELDRGERWQFLPAIRNLALGLAILIAILVAALVHDAIKVVA
jgi:hypothetical protein